MAAASLASDRGASVVATTRDPSKAAALRSNGASEVVIDSGQIAPEVRRLMPDGVDGVLELIGTTTLLILCAVLGHGESFATRAYWGMHGLSKRFEPLEDIPSTVRLTVYGSGTTSAGRSTAAFQEIVDGVASARYHPNIQRRFAIDEIVAAHRFMEENRGRGEIGCGGRRVTRSRMAPRARRPGPS